MLKKIYWARLVSHTCNLSYVVSGDGKIIVGDQPGQKSYWDPISKKKKKQNLKLGVTLLQSQLFGR
jgi:hypothetical protein